MSPRFFSKCEAILFGWNTLKKNFRFFLGMLAIVVVVNVLVGLVISSFSEEAPKSAGDRGGHNILDFELSYQHGNN